MTSLQSQAEAHTQLIRKIESISDVSVGLWKDTPLMCVIFKGKEVAHFHGQTEIDIRLSTSIIRKQNLIPYAASTQHPDRSPKSRWLVQEIRPDTVDQLVRLVEMAVETRKSGL